MTDYTDNYLKLKRLVDDLWLAIRDRDIARARELCSNVTVESRLLRQQITVHHERDGQN